MLIYRSVLLYLLLIAFGPCAESSSQRQPTQAIKQNLWPIQEQLMQGRTGARLYHKYCKLCHGKRGNAGIAGAADLLKSKLTLDKIEHKISKGGGGMPAFGKKMNSTELKQLSKYVLSFQKK